MKNHTPQANLPPPSSLEPDLWIRMGKMEYLFQSWYFKDQSLTKLLTNGSLLLSGRIAMLGRVVPREIGAVLEPEPWAAADASNEVFVVDWKQEVSTWYSIIEGGCERTGLIIERILTSDVTCRPVNPGRVEDKDDALDDADLIEDDVGSAARVKPETMLDGKLSVIVEEGIVFGIEVGIATGQKLHSRLLWSQYKSISNLRNPTASKFDKQSPELSSSYLRCGKQAAEKETPGMVT